MSSFKTFSNIFSFLQVLLKNFQFENQNSINFGTMIDKRLVNNNLRKIKKKKDCTRNLH